jgi:hypothetical protein
MIVCKIMKMNVEQVTDVAVEYLKKAGYAWPRVTKVISNEKTKQWKVLVNVGVIKREIKTIIIDDVKGQIIEFR